MQWWKSCESVSILKNRQLSEIQAKIVKKASIEQFSFYIINLMRISDELILLILLIENQNK